MTKHILAIFENGVLRPLQPLVGVPDHAEVDVTVHTRTSGSVRGQANEEASTGDGQADRKATSVRDCLGTISDGDAAELRRVVADEFEKVDQREW